MGRLLLLFIALPALELALLIEIGQRIGTLETLALIVITGIVGAALARSQGLQLIARVQDQLGRGEMPADSLVDGLMILVASALLVTPGVLTDVFGFLCLTPGFRTVVKREVLKRFERAVAENRVHFETTGFGSVEHGRPTIDITPPKPPSTPPSTPPSPPPRDRT